MSATQIEQTAVQPAEAFAASTRRRVRRDTREALFRLGVDLTMLAVAAAAASTSTAAASGSSPIGQTWLFVFVAVVLGYLGLRGSYRPRMAVETIDEVLAGVRASLLGGMVVVTGVVLVAGALGDPVPEALAADAFRLTALGVILLGTGRLLVARSAHAARRSGRGLRPTLIVGAGDVGRLTAERLLERPELGLFPVGFLDKEPRDGHPSGLPPVLGASWDFERVVMLHGIEHVLVAFSTAPNQVLLNLVRRCEQLGVSVALVPRLFEKMTRRLTVEHVGGLPFLTTRGSNPKGWQFAVKYALDRIVAAAIVVLLLPLLGAIALAVRISLGSPILFQQTRVGLDGRRFQMLKFRTMKDGLGEADAQWAERVLHGEAAEELESDDRRTRVGRLLRKLSLDELPQLFNVVAGDMSLVGPRPEREAYVRRFETGVRRYSDRHRVKSGMTGWAQINGLRGNTSLTDRVEWDNFYIENWSLGLDLKILLRTVPAVIHSLRDVE